MNDLTHIGPDGKARMVDVSDKVATQRTAKASGRIQMAPETLLLATSRDTKKGDPIAIAELAGIMAAKKTSDIIPLCHPLPLTNVEVKISAKSNVELKISAIAKTTGQTGVEMEALTAVSAAALTLYDMLKAVDKTMVINDIHLLEKTGGRSGNFKHSSE